MIPTLVNGVLILVAVAVACLLVHNRLRERRARIQVTRTWAARRRCPGLPVDGEPLDDEEFADAAELEIALIAQFGGDWIRQWNQQTSLMALMDAGRPR